MREAWRQTAASGEGVFYEEMRKASDLAENGISESEAYLDFASRCGEPAVDKIVSALVQNLTKGSRESAREPSATSHRLSGPHGASHRAGSSWDT
jgi:tight adherence protein C